MKTLNGGTTRFTVPQYHCRHFSLGLPGRYVEKNWHSWPISKHRVGAKNWGSGSVYIRMYLYICVLFELKFSTGQFSPKPDSPAQNRTPGNPTFHRVTLLKICHS